MKARDSAPRLEFSDVVYHEMAFITPYKGLPAYATCRPQLVL